MYGYLDAMEARLSEDQKDMLRRIYEPTVVGVPLEVARRDVCILPDGEIRSYGRLHVKQRGEAGTMGYDRSLDGGISWTRHYAKGKMNACVYVEKANLYITACDGYDGRRGLYVLRSVIGPDDAAPEVICVSEEVYGCTFLPQISAYRDRIWFTSQKVSTGCPSFFYSDDFGLTWQRRELVFPNQFETVFPHKGVRWYKGSGSEPHVAELSADCMMMIIRTPLDCFYVAYSYDGGNQWTEPGPSGFYGTNTTAFLLRLRDGRTVAFWNNTRPLAQRNHDAMGADVGKNVRTGYGENAFTSRDAAHAAITDDGGKSWRGYREILLNPIRNRSDFRYFGGVATTADKSVHQFQAFELPFGKILAVVGQSVVAARMVIFDVNWLYEVDRREDFLTGLENVTTHTYLNSISDCHMLEVGNGHCAWNRTYSAYPVPDPEGGFGEVLYVSKHHDDRLVSDISGITWNFPAAEQGRVTVELKLVEKQVRVVLTDRWYNTCDPYAAVQSPFWFELDTADLGTGFVKLDIDFDTEAAQAIVRIGDRTLFKVQMIVPCPTGISYLLLQCATDGDSAGFYIKRMEMQ